MLIEKGTQHVLHWHKLLMIGWEKLIVGAVLLDFSAAFGIIDHNLCWELMFYGFSTSALNARYGKLSNRTQRVFFNGSFSYIKHVKCDVLQGISLGPLHFSIFTNDLSLALNKALVSMYADDSTIYASATTTKDVTETLNKELQSVLKWVTSNKLVLNISKAFYLV